MKHTLEKQAGTLHGDIVYKYECHSTTTNRYVGEVSSLLGIGDHELLYNYRGPLIGQILWSAVV